MSSFLCRQPGFARALLLLMGAAALGAGAYHGTPLNTAEETNQPSLFQPGALPFKSLSNGVFSLGLVQLEPAKKTVSFPCSVNMAEGVVEYAIVHSTGKVHESVLKTEADPLHIQLATLLITPKGPAQTLGRVGTPRELIGPQIRIWVSWKDDAIVRRMPLENLVSNVTTRASMSPGVWVYNGSCVSEGTFLAHRDGSVVSIISDPDALMNNPRPGRDDDEIWRASDGLVPRVGTAVQVTLELTKDP